jgi:hypothetical protein
MGLASHRRGGASRVNGKPDFTGVQPDLFQQVQVPAAEPVDLEVNLELLGAISHAIREAKQRGLSRERIVDHMNALLPGRGVSKRQLDAWTAISQEHKEFPARYLPAFCHATGCDLPLRVLAQAIGRDLVDAREQVAKRLGENLIQTARLASERRELKTALGG